MNNLSGFNSQEMRRLHPYLSALLRRIKDLEGDSPIVRIITEGGDSRGRGSLIVYGNDDDILPTGDRNSGGNLSKVARADHQHLFKFPTSAPASTPDGSAYFDPSASAINIYVDNTPTTKVVAGGTSADVQPTGTAQTGTAPRYSFADHSHPTALLSQSDPQPPVVGEIRFNTDNKIVRWNGTAWVPLSVETFTIDWGTTADVQPTNRRSTGSTTRVARADHSHPTAILPQSDSQTPVVGEIRYNTDDKIVRWNGSVWVPLSVETFTIDWGTNSDVRATGLRNTGNSARVARADHSHPTALLPQGDAQTPALNEIRFSTDNKVVRWNGSDWVSLSVETFTVEWGNDVEPTRLRSAGSSTRFARADHSHPTAILPQNNAQTPVADEIRYNSNNKLVRWNGGAWVEMSVETVEAGTNSDVQPTKRLSAGSAPRFARSDHSHPTAILPQGDPQTPVADEIRYNAEGKLVRWDGSGWVPLSVEASFDVEWGTTDDVQATRLRNTGTATRFARADHSHPTAILPQNNTQTPVEDEIRYNTENKIVRWDGSAWVPLSVETFTINWGTDSDVQPTGARSTGTSTRVARADHSHPTVILDNNNDQLPVENEIRFNPLTNKIVRWDGEYWIEMSVETAYAGTIDEVQPTRLRSTGTSPRFARADHSHPTAILPQSNSQTPVVDEIRYTGTNQLVRWNGSAWVNFAGGLPVPANPLILPYTGDVSSPQNRQLVNHSSWDNIGNATVFYRDANNGQYRLIFARPLIVSTTSTPSGKDVWSGEADELVLKEGTGFYRGAVLWRRKGNTQDWSPVSVQLSDDGLSFPTDVGVLIRSALTGTSGSRRWFLRGAQEGGSFRAPFVGFATFTASTTPATSALSTGLGDGYAYYIQDLERVDIVRPISGGSTFPTMLPHYVISPPCRVFSTATDQSGHYVRDEQWNGLWVIRFYTTTSATTDLYAVLPTTVEPYGIQAGRVMLYLYNPQSSAITTIFAVAVRRPTSTTPITSATNNTSINIPANTAVVADLGVLTFAPSDTLSHNRSHPLAINIIRRRSQESANANSVMCLGVVIVPQRI